MSSASRFALLFRDCLSIAGHLRDFGSHGASQLVMSAILILEPDDALQRFLGALLVHDGFEPVFTVDGRQAKRVLESTVVAAMIVDVNRAPSVLERGRWRGAGFLRFLQRERPEMLDRVIVVSGLSQRDIPTDLPSVCVFLRKPFDVAELRAALRECVAQKAMIAS